VGVNQSLIGQSEIARNVNNGFPAGHAPVRNLQLSLQTQTASRLGGSLIPADTARWLSSLHN